MTLQWMTFIWNMEHMSRFDSASYAVSDLFTLYVNMILARKLVMWLVLCYLRLC
jgi:hypothetical protein